jgi:hypothetical protein
MDRRRLIGDIPFPFTPKRHHFFQQWLPQLLLPQSHTIQNTNAVNQEVLPLLRGTDKAKTITYGI